MKIWRYAGLMLTYKCSASCAFCYYCCGPQKDGLMDVQTALNAWEGLVRLAGTNASIHITGGEPFLFFDQLAQIVRQAHIQNLNSLDSIETNASWATDTPVIKERLEFLDAHGMKSLKISWDPFHAEFIDIQTVLRLQQTAQKILGPQRVLVRWEHFLQNPVSIKGLSHEQKEIIFLQAIKQDSCRFTGRAAFRLGHLASDKLIETLQNNPCRQVILGSKGVHIDPYGNVFNGQCSGICVGNINKTDLEEMWIRFDPENMPFWNTLFEKGPYGFLEHAVRSGYQPHKKYASKCHLCTDLRRFFFDKGLFSQIIEPKECYFQ